mmetsp:Transcript_106450/g.217123  ORF Transcript_106450/g.217123 Transcript_106450/m.217123 type:complete len:248 (-) Transcript_106450:607-1350(-)
MPPLKPRSMVRSGREAHACSRLALPKWIVPFRSTRPLHESGLEAHALRRSSVSDSGVIWSSTSWTVRDSLGGPPFSLFALCCFLEDILRRCLPPPFVVAAFVRSKSSERSSNLSEDGSTNNTTRESGSAGCEGSLLLPPPPLLLLLLLFLFLLLLFDLHPKDRFEDPFDETEEPPPRLFFPDRLPPCRLFLRPTLASNSADSSSSSFSAIIDNENPRPPALLVRSGMAARIVSSGMSPTSKPSSSSS